MRGRGVTVLRQWRRGAHRREPVAAGAAVQGRSIDRGRRFSAQEARGEGNHGGGEANFEREEAMEEGTGFTVENRRDGENLECRRLRAVRWVR
jgi:hypothetical protein